MAEPEPKRGFPIWALVPLAGTLAVVAVFIFGLNRDRPDDLPSVLVGKPAPQFALGPLYDDAPGLSTEDLSGGGVKLLNIWASWCVPCRAEHPILEDLAGRGIPVMAINYKDAKEDARAFLESLGNPFTLIGADTTGRVFIDWGSFGVPETFVINDDGRITYRHIGPISEADVERVILPEIEKARGNETDESGS